LPAKYGGEVTTNATELVATSFMSRASPTTMRSTAEVMPMVLVGEISGAWKRS
jgi:hypothetical protein